MENGKDIQQVFRHVKNSNSNLVIKISTSISDSRNKGFILEIFKSIDIPEKDIIYINKEVIQKEKLDMNKVVLFIYDKAEKNSAKNKIELYNDNKSTTKVNICIHRGIGKYPFIIKPECQDKNENIIINPKESFNISYNNPFVGENINIDDENNQFYVSILCDNPIKYSFKYEREIELDENQFVDLNHKGEKIFKLSKKINQKKSIYYQINLCENKDSNSNLYYSFNILNQVLIKNDIYQEILLDSIKSFFFQFNSKGNNNAKFKYFYGPANLLKTINNFRKDIYISKTPDDKNLLLRFDSPFKEAIELKIIFISDSQDKLNDFCSLEKFCQN